MQIIKRLLITSSYLLLARSFSPAKNKYFVAASTPNIHSETGATGANKDCLLREFSSKSQTKDNDMSDSYCPGTHSVAFVTTPDEKAAKKLAHGIIEKKLAACVNIIPQIQSIYIWEGKINEDNEYLLMIKTRSSRIDELSKYVRENHAYSVAEVISLPIENGNLPYLKWISETVPEKN